MNRKLQKAELDAALVRALVEDVHKPYRQLVQEFGVSINYLTDIVQRNGLSRKRGRGSPAWKSGTNERKKGRKSNESSIS